jgi:photosystem II stability/assembly factor-like uncharacterized protein
MHLRGISLAGVAACLILATAGKHSLPAAHREATSARYTWRNVKIVAGGFVDGIIFHPTARDVAYLRTDMGGAYRWDARRRIWIPITDWVSQTDWNLHGIESLALDPHDPNRVYLAAGTYTNNWAGNASMLRSNDRGVTWQRTDMPFKMGGNEDGRSAGERLAVDPNDGRILLFGSRHNGLWRSEDHGATWAQVTSFPITGRTNGVGLPWVVFNPASSKIGTPCKTIYVAVQQRSGPGIYVSNDSGATWSPVPGQPEALLPHQAKLDSRGDLYVTYGDAPGPNGMRSGAVYRWNTRSGEWTDISPIPRGSGGIAGLSLDPSHPGTLVVTTMDRWSPGDDLFRTTDDGKTWNGMKDKAVLDCSLSPFLKWGGEKPKFGWWMGAVALDPFRPNRVLFATGATIWESRDLQEADAGRPTHWSVGGEGVEQTAVTDLISPPAGAHLVSALGDICGFRHDDFNVSPPQGLSNTPITGSTSSLDFAENKPDRMVRVGNGKICGEISEDGGATWRAFASQPEGTRGGGHIAISADGATIIWSPYGASTSVSHDQGATWTPCEGVGRNVVPVTDRVNPADSYAYDGTTGTLLYSSNSGNGYGPLGRGFPTGEQGAHVRAVPGHEEDIWITVDGKLFHIVKKEHLVAHIATLDAAADIGFGKAAPGSDYPALYLIGKVGGVEGIFRSDDQAKTWVRINDDQHQYGPIGPIIGDPRVYGRVYVGSNGRGILYGTPETTSARR